MKALVFPHPYRHMAVTVNLVDGEAPTSGAILCYDAPPATSPTAFRRHLAATLRTLGFRVFFDQAAKATTIH